MHLQCPTLPMTEFNWYLFKQGAISLQIGTELDQYMSQLQEATYFVRIGLRNLSNSQTLFNSTVQVTQSG